MRKNTWACFLMILAGIVLGGFIGSLFPDSWLNFGQTFGLVNPIIFDIGILTLTFGLTMKITMASIIGVVIAIIVYRLV